MGASLALLLHHALVSTALSLSSMNSPTYGSNTATPRPYPHCPWEPCPRTPSVAELRAPGLGIALEMGYGTAVVRHHNESYQSIIRIDGDNEYLATMRVLSTSPKERVPYPGSENGTLDWAKQALLRKLRKSIGLPATSTTAVLARMVAKLHEAAEIAIDQKIKGCGISSPDHVRFKPEEVADVLDYLHLDYADRERGLGAISAAYAGLGEGLCSTYIDWDECAMEENRMPWRWILHLDLSSASLTGTIHQLYVPGSAHPEHSFISPELGLRRPEDGDLYWTAIGNQIREFVQTSPSKHLITELIVTGTSAPNAKFRLAIRDSLHDLIAVNSEAALLLERDLTVEEEVDLIFLTARGTAEIAKRRQEGPYKCVDSKKGAKRRRDQRPHQGGTLSLQKQDL